MPNDEAPAGAPNATGDKFLWIPILVELGEDVVARIIDRSPDVASALKEAKANFDVAVTEGEDLRRKGHENE